MLKIHNLNTHYGNIHALKGIDLAVNQGEIVSLIGSNGAGKSTTLLTIAGLLKPTAGSITFKGREISNQPPHEIVKMGISLSPEGREVFPGLSVSENLTLGAFIMKDKAKIKTAFERVYELFPRLKERRNQVAGTLSGGEQQMLAIARALMAEPQLLMLDEPSLGLAPNIVAMIFELIQSINQQGTTIMLIEQNANMAMNVSHRTYVLETGKISLQGDSKELIKNQEVKRAYLGVV